MYGRENLKPMSDLFLDMGDDVDGNRNYQPWAAYDKDDADNVMDAMENRIKHLESILDLDPRTNIISTST